MHHDSQGCHHLEGNPWCTERNRPVGGRKKVRKIKQFNQAGLFELFGSFSDKTAEDVHDCLMGWIYDNYNNVKSWLKMTVLHKKT